MRKFLNAMMVGLLLMGCSVDNDDTLKEDQFLIANSVLEVDGCESDTYNLYGSSDQKLGEFIITNDKDELYLNFASVEGNVISKIDYQVALSEDELPMNNGGIIVGQLENSVNLSSESYFGDSFSLDSFGATIPNALVVAARVQFVDESGQTNTVWIGDNVAGKNNSKFLDYTICIPQEEEVCEADAGTDQLREYTLEEIDALVYSPTSLADVYITLLDEGISTDGTFSDRTMSQLLTTFAGNTQYSRDYTTTYTVTNTLNGVECSDSVKLTIRVLDDRFLN